jgi:lysyl-tRNA synthetase class 2
VKHDPTLNLPALRRRAAALTALRAFFAARDVLEVDTPVLQGGANLDHGVVPFRVETAQGPRFLPTSPEHPLKRLVAAGAGAIWTLAPAFRADERGGRHSPEFRMLEWYRPGWDDRQLADEVVALLTTLTQLGGSSETVSWREAFRRHARLDPVTATDADLSAALGADTEAVRNADGSLDRAAALDLLLTAQVEPHLGRGCWTILTDYPAAACAQARIRTDADGLPVAARFEIYRDGIELANGYWELTDGAELTRRLEAELATRTHGEQLDRRFLACVDHLPDCAGVAVGFDRVLMLACGAKTIDEVQVFPWETA